MKIRLEISNWDDQKEVANILMVNGYKVWMEKRCINDYKGVDDNDFDFLLVAEKI